MERKYSSRTAKQINYDPIYIVKEKQALRWIVKTDELRYPKKMEKANVSSNSQRLPKLIYDTRVLQNMVSETASNKNGESTHDREPKEHSLE